MMAKQFRVFHISLCSRVDVNKDLMMMSVKNHQMAPTIRVDAAFGFSPDPCYTYSIFIYLEFVQYYELVVKCVPVSKKFRL